MQQAIDLLVDAFGRVRSDVRRALTGLGPDDVALRIDGEANSIAWLVWHLTRVMDDHVSELAGSEQVYTSQGWADRFALPFDPRDHGYGHSSEQVAAVRVDDPALLTGYHDAVHDHVVAYVRTLTADDLDRVIDDSWSEPVTTSMRLVSVIDDGAQHAGQAAFVAGIARNRR